MPLSVAAVCLAIAGLTTPQPAPQPILGGAVVGACGWPTVVSVGGFCSGTLIHPQVVAYAAHCGDEVPWIRFTDEIEATERREVIPEKCGVHPIGSFGFGTDFAYCRLAEPITDIAITPPLMGCETEEMLKVGQKVTLVGFGQSDDPDMNYGIKRFVDTQINGFSWDEVFVGDAEKGACYGDSGGPAMVQLADGSWRSFAVTSWGKPGCGAGNYFSLLHRGVDWIETETGLDVTPCHDSLGNWDPSPACGGFASGAPGTASGAWDTCSWDPPGGLSSSCGAAFDDTEDVTAPSVKIVDPIDGSRHNGKNGGSVLLSIAVEAVDEGWGTERVTFRIVDEDAVLFEASDAAAPFVFPQLQFKTGLWTLEAEAVDRAGNSAVSERITFGVNVDAPAPPEEGTSTGATTGDPETGDTPTMGGSEATGAEGGAGESSESSESGVALDDEGCGCRSEPGARGTTTLALGLLALGLRRRRRASVALALACGLGGCNNDETPTPGSTTGEGAESSSSSSGSPSTGEETPTTSTAESSTGEPVAACGNGEIDGDELCDDGNLVDGDGCNSNCQPSGTEIDRQQLPDGGVGIDSLNALTLDAEGNLVAAGTIGTIKDGSAAWVAKLSPAGEPIWEHTWASAGGNYNLYLDVAVGPDGQVAAGGFANNKSSAGDALLTVLDKDGKEVFIREIVEPMEFQQITDVVFMADGSMLTIESATKDLVAQLRAFDAKGDDLWTHSTDKEWRNGGLARVGTEATMVAMRELTTGETHDVRVFVIDDAKKVLWTKIHGDPLTRYFPERLAVGPEGDAVVCGSLVRTSAEDTVLLGIDAKGELRWKTRVPVPGPGYDYCQGVVITQDGGAAFAGASFTADAAVEMWVGKLDAAGMPVWAENYGSDGAWDDFANAIVELAGGELVIGGAFYDTVAKTRVRALLRVTP